MRFCLFILAFLLYQFTNAQIVPVQGVALNPIDQSIFSQWASEVDSETSNSTIVGSRYLFDDWEKGELTTIKGDRYENIDLKLDLHSDLLIYKNPFTNDSTLIMTEFLTSFKLNNVDTTFAFYYVPPRADQKSRVKSVDFYLVLLDGKTAVLGRPSVKIKRATQNSLVNADGQIKDKFVKVNEFYLREENGKVSATKDSKKAFAKSLPNFQDKIKQYIKENKSDPSKARDLVDIISYYNSLF